MARAMCLCVPTIPNTGCIRSEPQKVARVCVPCWLGSRYVTRQKEPKLVCCCHWWQAHGAFFARCHCKGSGTRTTSHLSRRPGAAGAAAGRTGRAGGRTGTPPRRATPAAPAASRRSHPPSGAWSCTHMPGHSVQHASYDNYFPRPRCSCHKQASVTYSGCDTELVTLCLDRTLRLEPSCLVGRWLCAPVCVGSRS
jgi:hypothetical protein